MTFETKYGKKETELVKSKNGKEYLKVVKEEITEKRQKDMPSRLNARRKIMRKINKVKDSEGNNFDGKSILFPSAAAGSNDVLYYQNTGASGDLETAAQGHFAVLTLGENSTGA